MEDTEKKFIKKFRANFDEINNITPELYSKYGVKKGLRNSDGTGVLAGITNISNVHGYLVNEGEKEPIEGRLTYRGYNIYDLIEGFHSENRFGFEEIAYLLMSGKLPNKKELEEFQSVIAAERNLPNNFTEDMIMKAPSKNLMNKLASATLNLYSYDPNPDDTSIENIMRQGISLFSKMPIIMSHAYQAKRRYYDNTSMYLHLPDGSKTTAENILNLIRADETYSDDEAKLLDMCLVIHAEHGGGNNSAFTARVTSSSGTDTYSAIAAAICSLKGHKHGGANHKVIEMYDNIRENVKDCSNEKEVYDYLIKILRKEANDKSGLIYGMGHAVYTLSDPRAVVLKRYAKKLAAKTGYDEHFALLDLIEKLTPVAYAEVKGYEKTMCSNVDMYSGLVYRMLNIPDEMYTPLFATARIAGWMAHRIEEVATGGKIIRPAYKPIQKKIQYISMSER
ncbi:MAG: citrate/2-methylcitrate synthase [Firmicutes bacterium]|nr:citrate/2-methylcitrate synthase [Bacillota bacterium]